MDGAIHLRYPEDGLKLSLRASFLHTIVGSTAVFRLAKLTALTAIKPASKRLTFIGRSKMAAPVRVALAAWSGRVL